ncbi:MAG TPA: prenyltransferase [Terriglobales bacterium]|nr:prenyltransferase [Terriglobales bacterium]
MEARAGRVSSPLAAWRTVLSTCNAPTGAHDFVTRWLVLTRACVQPMTLTSAAIAGLLAVRAPGFDLALFLLAAAGLVVAHGANNLINDIFDERLGTDTASYPRALYAPHPVVSGMTTRVTMIRAALLLNTLDLAILVLLVVFRGWPVAAFALAGLVVSVGYTAPVLRFKKRGLGEPAVLVVWGPLMVGGTYYAATGHLTWQVLAASVPYALLSTTVLLGKHLDKIGWDRPLGIGTLPVLLGERVARDLTLGLMVAFYVAIVALVVAGALPIPALLALLALPRLRQAWPYLSRPRPERPPPDFPVWPLWYAAAAFVHTRRAGALLVAGLLVGAVLGFTHLVWSPLAPQ